MGGQARDGKPAANVTHPDVSAAIRIPRAARQGAVGRKQCTEKKVARTVVSFIPLAAPTAISVRVGTLYAMNLNKLVATTSLVH